ncbi:DUF6894 family protein [Labrys wisconsinensis]|uniref:DUF6894 domain-containing protein n=1 Tax=Labrys wisconsinensis TaxID=425677 RepID=A0ABU0JDA6_9HYPH|nr:hypothetical protein [Labrys wisconsinensis]MDQ0471496.1 hypothetical protein [Labrys wisconsinensis]
MSRFYFHLRQQDGLTIDDEGYEARDVAQALEEGMEAVRAVLVDALLAGIDVSASAFECTDEQGDVLFFLEFATALH